MPLPSYQPARLPVPARIPPPAPLFLSARRLGHAPNSPVTVTGANATVTVTAPASGAAVSLATPAQVQAGAPAAVTISCDPGDVSIDGGNITLLADTAEVSADVGVGIAAVAGGQLGDNFANPYLVAGAGGTLTVNTTGFSVEAGEPDIVWSPPQTAGDPGTYLVQTAWIRYTPSANGTLTVRGAIGAADLYQIELFEGDALDNLVRVDRALSGQFGATGEIAPTLTDVTGAHQPVYIRFLPTGFDTTDLIVDLTVTFAADAHQQGALSLTTTTSTFSISPGVIRCDVIGGTPGGDLVFDLQGTTASFANPPGVGLGNAVATYSADTSGNLYGASIALPTVSAGTYTLRVTDSASGLTDSATIQVEADPIVAPSTIPPDNPVGSISHGTTVKYWLFKDPVSTGLGTYLFTINPTTMTSPHAPRNVVIEHTVAVDGHDMIWEGAYKANEWHFQGIVLAQADYEAILAFEELNRRFWIVDHRDRAWVASIESIGWTKHRAPYNNWAWDYDITALIYSGPTSI